MSLFLQSLWEKAPMVPYVEGNRVNAPNSLFRFFAWTRNPRLVPVNHGDPDVAHHIARGVRKAHLLELYCKVLEAALGVLSERMPCASTSLPFKIPVFVCDVEHSLNFDGCPLMVEFPVPPDIAARVEPVGDGAMPIRPRWAGSGTVVIPCIILRSRFKVSTQEEEDAEATAEAVHEVRHLYNAAWLPWKKKGALHPAPGTGDWLWFDEALCMLTEAELPEPNDRWLCYMLDWVDSIGQSLVVEGGHYQAAMFARYIRRVMYKAGRERFLEEVWAHSVSVWDCMEARSKDWHTPLSAMSEELAKTPEAGFTAVSSPDPSVRDLFASGYCFDSYFLHDCDGHGHEPEVFDRFREQAITHSWDVADCPCEHSSSLPELACHYFRVYPDDVPRSLGISLQADEVGAPFKVIVTMVEESTQRPVKELGQALTSAEGGLTGEFPSFSTARCEYALIVVASAPVIRLGHGVSSHLHKFTLKLQSRLGKGS